VVSDWTINYTWYYCEADGSLGAPVSPAELDDMRDLVWHDYGQFLGEPGYLEIADYTYNQTKTAMQARAFWIPDELEWDALTVSLQQEFPTEVQTTPAGDLSYKKLIAELFYSGLALWQDLTTDQDPAGNKALDIGIDPETGDPVSSELTHVFVIEAIDEVEFLYPTTNAAAFGTQPAGTLSIAPDDTLHFGVNYSNLNGTLYPVGDQLMNLFDINRGTMTLWMVSDVFDRIPSVATVESLGFVFHLGLNEDQGGNINSELKIDQSIGLWDVFMHDGSDYDYETSRKDELLGRSLASMWNSRMDLQEVTVPAAADGEAGDSISVVTDDQQVVSGDDNGTISDGLDFKKESNRLASLQVGGFEYTWNDGVDSGTETARSITTSKRAIDQIFGHKDSGRGFLSYDMGQNWYYLTGSFVKWDGAAIEWDPSFDAYFNPRFDDGGGGENDDDDDDADDDNDPDGPDGPGGIDAAYLPFVAVSLLGFAVLAHTKRRTA
jgi:hypothetical protein